MKLKLPIIALLSLGLLLGLSTFALADDTTSLNEIGKPAQQQSIVTEQTPSQVVTPQPNKEVNAQPSAEDYQSKAQAVEDLFSNNGVTTESLNQAQVLLAPFALIMNKFMALILGIISIALFFITMLDMVYITFPPTRLFLSGGAVKSQGGQQNGIQQMQRDYNRGGYSSYNSYNSTGYNTSMQQNNGPSASSSGSTGLLGRWISDEALAAAQEAEGAQGNMYAEASQRKPFRNILLSYIKKRSLFLIIFGVTAILFTSTIFTDIGVKLGMLILGWLSGFHI